MKPERRQINKARDPRAPMEPGALVRLLRHIDRHRLPVWLDGGWGIDALLCEQTREHDDVDLIATVADSPRLIAALGELGYELAAGETSMNFVLLDSVGRQVDVHPVTFNSRGDGIYRMENGEQWTYPAWAFAGEGTVGSCSVRCLTADAQVLCHNAADYQFDDDDYRDLFALHRRFGVAVPPDVLAWPARRSS